MIIRDIKILSEIIDKKINLGLELDLSILTEFEKETRIKNFLFSNSIDFIYKNLSFDKKLRSKSFN